jgi:tRNA pseudouridine38-40 synthase
VDLIRTLKLTISYDGTRFGGWQRQNNRRTVQEVLEDALENLTGSVTSTVAAGRTDAGVHARGQVVSFRTTSRIPPQGFRGALNAKMPEDVAVVEAAEKNYEFHAQRDAKGKLYRFTILNRRTRSPLDRRFTYRVPFPLDVDRMTAAAGVLVGRHDFSSFRNAGSTPGSAVRTLRCLDIRKEGDYIRLDVTGDGFLYRMVRNLAGTLILVGRGKLPVEDVSGILVSRDRCRAGPAAPARGLCLVEVFY